MSHVKQLRARYVMSFCCSFQSVRRVRRYIRLIGKVHWRLHQRPPNLCVAVSYNHQVAIHHRSLYRVIWSPVCSPSCVSFLLRLVFFVPYHHLFQYVKFDNLVAMALSSRRSFRRILFLSRVISRKQASPFLDNSFL